MSSRPQFQPHVVINNGDMSGDLVSSPTIILKLSMVGYSYSWVGTSPVGTVSVQVSNDYSIDSIGNVLNSGTWTALTVNYNGSPVTEVPVSGDTGSGFIDVDATGAYAIRTIYTSTSGTGTLKSIVNAKVA